ncbi:MAG: hypothetical protein US54_C0043G0001, partial [Candidatus Roizmanbacteria bacterium GW2011_GWA2_37_7]
ETVDKETIIQDTKLSQLIEHIRAVGH